MTGIHEGQHCLRQFIAILFNITLFKQTEQMTLHKVPKACFGVCCYQTVFVLIFKVTYVCCGGFS